MTGLDCRTCRADMQWLHLSRRRKTRGVGLRWDLVNVGIVGYRGTHN